MWEGAQLIDDFHDGDKQLRINTDAGDERVIEIRTKHDLPLLRNPTILIGQNDLTALSYLHEPDVLHTLEVRLVFGSDEQRLIIQMIPLNAIEQKSKFHIL